jgi:hypothetical protein
VAITEHHELDIRDVVMRECDFAATTAREILRSIERSPEGIDVPKAGMKQLIEFGRISAEQGFTAARQHRENFGMVRRALHH